MVIWYLLNMIMYSILLEMFVYFQIYFSFELLFILTVCTGVLEKLHYMHSPSESFIKKHKRGRQQLYLKNKKG